MYRTKSSSSISAAVVTKAVNEVVLLFNMQQPGGLARCVGLGAASETTRQADTRHSQLSPAEARVSRWVSHSGGTGVAV